MSSSISSSMAKERLGSAMAVLALFVAMGFLWGPRLRQKFENWRSVQENEPRLATRQTLTLAIDLNDVALADRLLVAGVDPNANSNGSDRSPLHRAIELGSTEMVQLLLEHGADPDGQAATGSVMESLSAMDLAIRKSDGDIADLLKKHGAQYGPREAVALNRMTEVESMLRADRAIVTARVRPIAGARHGQEPTLLGIAVRFGHRELASFLIKHGASVDSIEGLGGTLLHQAAIGGDPQLIRLLVDHGLDVNARDDYQDTPLHDAWNAPTVATEALIKAGADVNAAGITGNTALHLAVSHDRREIASLLLAAGADAELANNRGETARELARANKFSDPHLLERTAVIVPHDRD